MELEEEPKNEIEEIKSILNDKTGKDIKIGLIIIPLKNLI